MLATLYREMCKATPPNKAKIGGYLSLLQSWVQFRFLFLRPPINHPYTFPLITSYVGIPTALEDIRLLLDQLPEAQSNWSTMLLSRYTRLIECCSNLDSNNRFSRHLRCLMMSTKSTYEKRIRIGRHSSRNISKFDKTGMIIYLLPNRSSFQS
ncbi:hypothetical protein Gotur_012392 [Gossypium turneri]